MREIKFRGKGINSGQWFYGSAVTFGNKAYIFKMLRLLRMEHAEVVPDTVGQFIGLFDEDGREIYEGDIIKIVEEFDDENVYTRIGVVCFEEGMYELQDKNGKHFAYLGWLMHDDAITKLEVIGNIHDNPEMLEKGGEQ
jgi:uncharacterized phage protein (TIGR01671 family)